MNPRKGPSITGIHIENSHPIKVTAIIPARNEAGRIGSVLAVLRQVSIILEILVVDDGSIDQTANEVIEAAGLDPRIRLLQHPINQGKGQAIFTGRRVAQGELILLLDADLGGLTIQHITDLIEPITAGQADMTIGLFRGGDWWTDLPHMTTPWLTGQRCLKVSVMDDLPEEAAQGYGFETALTVIARRNKVRIRRVYLRGVSHPVGEIHRGLFKGIANRLKMYRQIYHAWQQTQPRRRWISRRKVIFYRFFTLFVLLAFLSSSLYNTSVARSKTNPNVLPLIDLTSVHRILVIAPHPDDESIANGGLIQKGLGLGDQVKIIIVTNGDGQIIGPLALNYHPIWSAADFIRIGKERQLESLNAMKLLGLSTQDVVFLSYPDGGTNSLWFADWVSNCPYKSSHTQVDHSPYADTFNPNAQYCGKDLLKDLLKIITDYRPDFISIPHPNDEHPDHRGVSGFARMAVSLAVSNDASYQPEVYGYLVHYGKFPQPRGNLVKNSIMPPKPLLSINADWQRITLTAAQEDRKGLALKDYHTQEKLLGSFLNSFIRTDEVFIKIPIMELAPVSYSEIGPTEEGILATPTLQEPANESTRRVLMAAADLVGWQTLRLGDTLWFIAKTRGQMVSGFSYYIYVKSPDGKTLTVKCNSADHHMSGNTFFEKVSLAELGDPSVLGFSAEVQERMTLDRTAWHFVILR